MTDSNTKTRIEVPDGENLVSSLKKCIEHIDKAKACADVCIHRIHLNQSINPFFRHAISASEFDDLRRVSVDAREFSRFVYNLLERIRSNTNKSEAPEATGDVHLTSPTPIPTDEYEWLVYTNDDDDVSTPFSVSASTFCEDPVAFVFLDGYGQTCARFDRSVVRCIIRMGRNSPQETPSK